MLNSVDMIETGTKISIVISEPWDTDQVLNGIIIRSFNFGNYWVLKEYDNNQLYIISCRFIGEKLSDILTKNNVIVGIAIPLPELELLTISEIKSDDLKWFKYVYIGAMKLASESMPLKNELDL
jgi:hypothetical protein